MAYKKSKKVSKYKPKSRVRLSKNFIKWATLVLVTVSLPLGYFFGAFSFEYSYLKCRNLPLEINGIYYRFPTDKGYGLRLNSRFICYDEIPDGTKPHPDTKLAKSTKDRKEEDEARIASISDYTVYMPEGYEILSYNQSDNGDRLETSFRIITENGREYRVRELKKDSIFSYTNLCSKPAEGSWSGKIIGADIYGREICKVNPSKYIKDYIVGINVDNTAIMLQTKTASEELLNPEATTIFNAMKPSL